MVKCVFYVNSQYYSLSLEANKQQTKKLLNDACKIFCRCLAVFGVSILYAFSLYSAIKKYLSYTLWYHTFSCSFMEAINCMLNVFGDI